MPVEHLSVLPAILGVEAAPDAYAHNDGAAADHNGHDDNARRGDDGHDHNARRGDDDDDDSRSRSHSPRDRRCRRVTDSQVVDRIAAVVVAHMQDDYTARLEDRLLCRPTAILISAFFTHISYIQYIYIL